MGIFVAFKTIAPQETDNIIKQALMSQSSMARFVRYRMNEMGHLMNALALTLLLPKKGVILEHDGTERVKRNLVGMILQFKPRNLRKFKTWMNGKQRIKFGHHLLDKKNRNMMTMIIGYKDAAGKDAQSLFECFQRLFNDMDKYKDILLQEQNKKILIDAFGAENINQDKIADSISCTKTDRASVKPFPHPS